MKTIIKTTVYLFAAVLGMVAAGTVFAGLLSQAGSFVYREQTGDTVHEYVWQLKHLGDQVVITSREPGKFFQTTCAPDGSTLSWEFKGNDGSRVIARRHGDKLIVERNGKGQKEESTETLDERPWYQPLSYSLRAVAEGEPAVSSFWMIRPDTLEVVSLTAEKKKCGTVEVNQGAVPACEVEIRKEGLFASFWHASYWFRQNDKQFVRYEAVHGAPGTPETVIQLVEELH
ncbi:hypothetical protein [Desulfogranum japonicum]|uniref:hypothetical protein n=1 Tax=Desulfogranum japonicum TaxID=231447 RepID=UPI0003F632CE|nr:hypothetical protein [Desulfogranum japonicum]